MKTDADSPQRLLAAITDMTIAAYLADNPDAQVRRMAKLYGKGNATMKTIYNHKNPAKVVILAYWKIWSEL